MTTATLIPKQKDAILDAGFVSRADVDMLSARLNEPEWLKEQRQTAWSIFEETPMPTTSDEAWRRTSLRKIKWAKFGLTTSSSLSNGRSTALTYLPEDVHSAREADRPAAGPRVFLNNPCRYSECSPHVLEPGRTVCD